MFMKSKLHKIIIVINKFLYHLIYILILEEIN
jgi:hypothetical protein